VLVFAFSWIELAIAAPLGFIVGVAAGLLMSNRYALIHRDELERLHDSHRHQ
jgi:hypothetical protein